MSIKTTIKKILPKRLWNFLRHYRGILVDRITNFGSAECHIQYCGFNLSYSAGTILIKKIRNGKIFEEEMCKSIVSELSKSSQPIFLDIGANIGLISLYTLSKIPAVKIFAFEPGPDQNKQFNKTIKENSLSEVSLSNQAVGETEEKKTFMTHFSQDSSGDGFVDTGRAGEPRSIGVEVTTLDAWWEKAGRPRVNVVKIDIEGAELFAMKGATKFLQEVKPLIYLEIEPKNLKVYTLNPQDIHSWFTEHSYDLFTLDNEKITPENLDTQIGLHDTFIAKPR